MEIYIIGNGIFGRITKDLLAKNGIKSTIIDSGEANSGSRASGNITKPSWVMGLGANAKQAYKDLDELYGLEKFSPSVGLGKTIDLFFVPRTETLKAPDIIGYVTSVRDGALEFENRETLEGKILVAAGSWSSRLVSMPTIDSIVGVSAIFEGVYEPKFAVWAPFKQSINYSYAGQTWFGDGTAIKEKNFNPVERVANTLRRAKEQGLERPVQTYIGHRPYVKGYKNGYFAKVHEDTWVSTGGGKNGIVLAAIQARKFLEEIS